MEGTMAFLMPAGEGNTALVAVNKTAEEAARVLDVEDPIALWHDGLDALDARMDAALGTWREIVAIMPPIRNVALRDTLASLGELKRRYDTRFAAHEVPCDIDYQLSAPVGPQLLGLDYIEAWLAQLLAETRWIAQFDTTSCIAVLERTCPDYRGLHVNLYDLLLPHEDELVRIASGGSTGHTGYRLGKTENVSLYVAIKDNSKIGV